MSAKWMMVLLLAVLGFTGCSEAQTASFDNAVRSVATQANEEMDRRSAKSEEPAAAPDGVNSYSEDANSRGQKIEGVPNQGGGQPSTKGGVINIQGETYVDAGSGNKGGSGFSYNGRWYARSGEYRKGAEFVVGNQNQGGGFWQHSKYWVPAGSGGGGGISLPGVINIDKQSYVLKGRSQTSSSGFWYGGQWYERSNGWIDGTRFVEGNQKNSDGFWQNSKYWVRK